MQQSIFVSSNSRIREVYAKEIRKRHLLSIQKVSKLSIQNGKELRTWIKSRNLIRETARYWKIELTIKQVLNRARFTTTSIKARRARILE